MDLSHLLVFATAYLAVLASPGPGVTALVARVLARGTQGSAAFIAGIVTGALLWFTLAATGLAAIASSFGAAFVAIRYAGAAYLLYVAWKLWNRPAQSLTLSEPPLDDQKRAYLSGLAINLANPKAIVFFLALLPAVVDLAALTPLAFAELALVIVAIASGVLTAYAMAAARARELFTSPRAVRNLNRGSSTVMAGTALAMVAR